MDKIILGIDPGIGRCGFGVIKFSGNNPHFIDCGVIETSSQESLPKRLCELRQDFIKILQTFKPDLIAIEELFFTKNITTGIAVAGARGVLLEAAQSKNFLITEIQPRNVKMAVAGIGNAAKSQVQKMAARILKLDCMPKPDDAADALAIALAAQNNLQIFR
ncbi:MAG: crossover junction endodeoxyribonuclease RuvC [Patescibacteria group bacterium]|nr:crossover junction endodeoxyribonuclease RuvC [Patescibacteria group bacterium]